MKEKYMKMLINNIKLYLKLSMHQLINDLSEERSPIPVSLELSRLFTERNKAAVRLGEFLKDSDSDRLAFCTDIAALRDRVLKEAASIFMTVNYNELIENMLMYELVSGKYTATGSEDEAEMAADMLHDVLHTMEGDKLSACLSALMSSIPCRMTKAIFGDYVKRAARQDTGDCKTNDEAIWFYNMIGAKTLPFKDDKARLAFPEEFEKLDGILKNSLSSMKNEDISKLADETDRDSREIYEIADIASMLYTDFSYMIILANYGYDIDFLTDDDIVLKDLFYAAIEYASKEKPDEADRDIAAEISDRSADITEALMDEVRRADDRLAKYTDTIRNLSQDDESLEHIYTIYNLVTYIYYSEAENAAMDYYNPDRPDEVYNCDSTAEKFCAFFEESIKELPAYNRRLIRKELISQLKCPCSIHEVIDYISDALSYYNGRTEANNIYDVVIRIMELADEDNHDHHHDHDHDHDHHEPHFHKHL